jgi:nicotinamidase-related amidase
MIYSRKRKEVLPESVASGPMKMKDSMLKFPRSRLRSERALLIIDMVESMVYGPDAIAGAKECIRFIEGELRYFRERDRSILFLSTLGLNTAPSPFISELTPRSTEPIIYKSAPDGFFGSNLSGTLDDLNVSRLTLTGVVASTSILLTGGSAMARGYHVVVPNPCVADNDPESQGYALHLIRNVWKPIELEWPVLALADAAV